MTDLDAAIKKVFDDNNVRIYPCKPLVSGQLQVGEIKSQFNCIVETYLDEENLENGKIKLRSGFYMFVSIKKDLDVLEDVNPKQEILSNLCRKVIRELQYTKYNVKLEGKLIAGIYNTTANETGKAFTLTFEYAPQIV